MLDRPAGELSPVVQQHLLHAFPRATRSVLGVALGEKVGSAGVALGQQKRSGTPAQAVADGANGLVAGSQVTKSDNPIAAFRNMASEIGE